MIKLKALLLIVCLCGIIVTVQAGTSILCLRNNLIRYEAEFCDENTILSMYNYIYPEKYNYMSSNKDHSRAGYTASVFSNIYANGYYWQVNRGQAGLAYHDMICKQPLPGTDIYRRIGTQFRISENRPNPVNKADTLCVTFAMRCDVLEAVADTTVLADIWLTCKGETTATTDSTLIPHQTAFGSKETVVSHITKADYLASASTVFDMHFVQVKVPLTRLKDSGALRVAAPRRLELVNLNPNLYWYGHGVLKLDYIEFKAKLIDDAPVVIRKSTAVR